MKTEAQIAVEKMGADQLALIQQAALIEKLKDEIDKLKAELTALKGSHG